MKLILNFLILSLSIPFLSCSTDKFQRVPEDQFIGTWQLKGRSMFDNILIEISRNDKGKLTGKIKKLNDNKYVEMFATTGDIWVSDISRSSNFQFKITEKKIARELFGLYGLSSSTEFKAEFIDKHTIGLSSNGDPEESSVRYVRVNESQSILDDK